jgi:2-succinyl-5-enolpyruvyl-6-hydroxy-3-cyclohexene-1-carboxylate synthase
MSGGANHDFAESVVDEWCRAGMSDAVVCPGSRSTPLALALARSGDIRVHVHLDERSGAFLALGLAKATGRPSVVVCTSGTAAANLHPAVLEAYHARVPLIACTADRPRELREVGAGQTIDQYRLFGPSVRWFFEPDAPADVPEARATWRALAARAVAEAGAPPPGPVHLNLPFREPFLRSDPSRSAPPPSRERAPWVQVRTAREAADPGMVAELAETMSASSRVVLVAGFGAGPAGAAMADAAGALGLPLLADPISGARRGAAAISTYEALSRVDALREELAPDLVVRVGAPLTSRHTGSWLAEAPTVLLDPVRSWLDPARSAEVVFEADGACLLREVAGLLRPGGDGGWLETWLGYERKARLALDRTLDAWLDPFDGRVARDVMSALPDGSALTVASSMAVRDLEAFAAPRRGVEVFANRGVNGIDGFVSTTVGVAISRGAAPTVALTGDLCFLHDANGLLGASKRGADAVFVVLDNDGGGIFSFLPQAGLPDHFEELFAAPQDVDLLALAELHGASTTDVLIADEIPSAMLRAIAEGGIHVLRAASRRDVNAERHRTVIEAVTSAVTPR